MNKIKSILRKYYHRYKEREVRKKLESNCKIDKSAIILPGSNISFSGNKDDRIYLEVGEKSLVCFNAIFETSRGQIKIGNNVNMGYTTIISRNSVTVEDNVTMAWGITLYDHNSHSVDWDERQHDNERCYADTKRYGNPIVSKDWSVVRDAPVRICKKAWIGFNVIVLKGVTIGEGAVIGAGSVVAKDIPPFCIAAGNPAKVIRYLNESQEMKDGVEN